MRVALQAAGPWNSALGPGSGANSQRGAECRGKGRRASASSPSTGSTMPSAVANASSSTASDSALPSESSDCTMDATCQQAQQGPKQNQELDIDAHNGLLLHRHGSLAHAPGPSLPCGETSDRDFFLHHHVSAGTRIWTLTGCPCLTAGGLTPPNTLGPGSQAHVRALTPWHAHHSREHVQINPHVNLAHQGDMRSARQMHQAGKHRAEKHRRMRGRATPA